MHTGNQNCTLVCVFNIGIIEQTARLCAFPNYVLYMYMIGSRGWVEVCGEISMKENDNLSIKKLCWTKKGYKAPSDKSQGRTKQYHEPVTPYIARVPIPWIAEAGKLPGRTVVVALAILYVHGMKPEQDAVLTRFHFDKFDVSRGIVQRGMNSLQEAGLIKYTKKGNSYIVTVIPTKSDTPAEFSQ